MNTHRDSVTHTEEQELNDDRILKDIQRRMAVATIPQEFDARALAVRAVEEYWAGREQGVIEPDGTQRDATYVANLAAIKRLRKDDGGRGDEVMNILIVAGTVLGVVLTLWWFPSLLNRSAGLFQRGNFVIAATLLLMGVLVIVGLVDSRLREKWLDEGRPHMHHLMGLVVGGLLAAVVTLGIGLHTEKARQRTAEEIAARRQAEEARRQAEEKLGNVTRTIAREQILGLSREVMQEQYKTGSFEKAQRAKTLPVGDQKITVRREKADRDNAVYQAEGEPLPKPVEIRMNNVSGQLIVEGKEEGRFYAAVVEATSGDTLTLSVRNDDGSDGKLLTWPIKTLKFQPEIGQRLFVVVDPTTDNPTEVREFPDSRKNEPDRPR